MVSRQSSIKGRGTEILVGVPRAVAIQPEESTAGAPEAPVVESPQPQPAAAQPAASPAVAAPPAPVQDVPPLSDADLEAALYEEARAAEHSPAEEAPWIAQASWPLTPEMELALIEHDYRVKGAPGAAPAPVPVAQMAGMAEVEVEEAAAVESEVPLTLSDEYYDLEDEPADVLGIEPAEKPERIELPERPLTGEQQEAIAEQEADRIQRLSAEIDRLYAQVLAEVGDSEEIATLCYNDLLKARDIVLRRDVARLAQAEYYLEQARARLRRAATSGAGARKNAWWIFAWGLLWGMGLVALLVVLDTSAVHDMIDSLDLRSPFVDPKIMLPAMVWGAIGGVVAIWYSLFKHIAQRDFDGHYNITYIGKPFFGLILGATVYMVINLLLVSLGVWSSAPAEGATITPTLAPWIIYLISWIAGFKENRVFGLVDDIMKRLFPKAATPVAPTDTLG